MLSSWRAWAFKGMFWHYQSGLTTFWILLLGCSWRTSQVDSSSCCCFLFLFALHPRIIFDCTGSEFISVLLRRQSPCISSTFSPLAQLHACLLVCPCRWCTTYSKLLQSWGAASAFQITFWRHLFFLGYRFKALLLSLCTQTASKFCCCSSAVSRKMHFPAFFSCLLVLPL